MTSALAKLRAACDSVTVAKGLITARLGAVTIDYRPSTAEWVRRGSGRRRRGLRTLIRELSHYRMPRCCSPHSFHNPPPLLPEPMSVASA